MGHPVTPHIEDSERHSGMTHTRAILCSLVAQGAVLSTSAGAMPDGVVELETGAATYLTTREQQTLYYHGRETAGDELVCIEACLDFWRPLEAPSIQDGGDKWAVIERPEGTLQWAYKGRPLYTYARDTFPGARLGDGAARDLWNVVKEFKQFPPNMTIDATLLGYVLASHSGKSLYVRDNAGTGEAQSEETVDESLWTPFRAPWLALDQGDLTVVDVGGGVRQWAYKGNALYTFNKDIDPGDVLGHGRDDVWSVVILEKAQGLPSWMTLQWTDLGLAYADGEGMTLYAPIDIEVINAAQSCPDDCMQENWVPVLAADNEKPVGLWDILENEDGQRQWTYKGRFLYTHTRDERPGEIKGNGIAVGYRIGDGFRIIPVESGLRRDRS